MSIKQWEGVLTHVDKDGNKQQMFPEIKTDASLSISGKAADAAVTGARFKYATPVKILQADFDKLSDEQKAKGSYLITDAGIELPLEPIGGGGVSAVAITQAEYDALPQSEKMNGSLYAITDAEDLTAKNLAYDGSVTGLGDNVQDAIDKNAKNISELNKNFNKFVQWWIDNEYLPDPDKPKLYLYNGQGLAYFDENWVNSGDITKEISNEMLKITFKRQGSHCGVCTTSKIDIPYYATKLKIKYTGTMSNAVQALGIANERTYGPNNLITKVDLSTKSTIGTLELDVSAYAGNPYNVSLIGANGAVVNIDSIWFE